MNRRNFLIKTSLGVAVCASVPVLAIDAKEIPLHKQFDYVKRPVSYLFRINKYPNGITEIVSAPIAVKTCRLKIVTDENIDLTQDKIGTHYTNELLLNEIKQNEFTHIYEIKVNSVVIDPSTYKKMNGYYVRGAKCPEWKTNNGEIRIVYVNYEGKTSREILTNKYYE